MEVKRKRYEKRRNFNEEIGHKKKGKRKNKEQIRWIKHVEKIKIHDPLTMRGEDTSTYGEATDWLQPGTPKGDIYARITGMDPGTPINNNNNESENNSTIAMRKNNFNIKKFNGFRVPKKKK